MASGHVNRTQRPNTWLHRPTLRREDSPCQLGAVHTWPLAPLGNYALKRRPPATPVTEAKVTSALTGPSTAPPRK
jgi:hypothetical protein